ncbi:MAG: amidophosphoribosyltransferase, partial [Candidatus Nanoarchaeia archaeon]
VDALQNVRGAYSLIVVHDNKMYVARDPDGYRPLCHVRKGNCVVFASENVALEDIGATYCGEVPAGKLFTFSQEGFEECSINRSSGASKCIFELIYFAHPSSRIFNMVSDNSAFRQRCGEALWRENPADVDIIFPSPDSGIDAAIGYSRAAGKETSAEYARGLVRSHTVGRTFIMPKEDSRIIGIRRKLKPTGSAVNGKRVLFVDDSIVRGNTSKELVSMLREAGAQEVHVRVASPPIRAPCDMGMDFPTYDELAASGRSVEEVCGMIEADSLEYLSQSGLLACAKELGGEGFCTSCFTGEMPSELVRIRKEKGLYRDPSGLAP